MRTLAASFDPDLPAALLVVQHTHPAGPALLAQILDRAGRLPAAFACSGDVITAGRIFVAPPDRHLLVSSDGALVIDRGPRENLSRPAIDPLFRSAALALGPGLIGVILTGDLDDGAAGLKAVKLCGGTTIVQDPNEAEAPEMPRNAIRSTAVDHCVDIASLGPLLDRLAREPIYSGDSAGRPRPVELEIEAAVRAGDMSVLEGQRMFTEPSLFTCPECHGVLSRLRDEHPVRYRCHTGHAFTADSLVAALSQSTEAGLWSVVRSLQEQAMLLAHLASHARAGGELEAAERLQRESDAAQSRATAVRELPTSAPSL